MLRGLLIRQGLLLVDLLLAGAIVVMAYFVVSDVFAQQDILANESSAEPTEAPQPERLRTALNRQEYDIIGERGLYGPAGNTSSDAPPAEVLDEPTEIETTLPLQLFGTVSAFPTDPLATAIIENGFSKTTETYYLNQPVVENVILAEVHDSKVVLFNKAKNTRENLYIKDDSLNVLQGAAVGSPEGPSAEASRMPPRPGRMAVTADAGEPTALKREELIKDLEQIDFAQTIAELSPELVHDANGKVTGITSKTVENIPMAKKFGFKNGDEIQMINGVPIDSQQRIIEVFNRFQNAPTHWVRVMRNGKPQTLVFKIE